MVKQKDDDALAKARRLIEAADKKFKLQYKKWFAEAAKEARSWRNHGILQPCEVYEDGKSVRYLKRC